MSTLKTALWGAGIIGTLLAITSLSGKSSTPEPEMKPEEPKKPKPAQPASTDRVLLIQKFLNKVMPSLPQLTTDGITGPKTVARIQDFQKMLTQKGHNVPATGTWGNITEAVTLAVYGYTPFQTGKAPAPATPAINTGEAQKQGELRAKLVGGYIWPIGIDITFRDRASVTGKILSTLKKPDGYTSLGKVAAVDFEKGASGTMYTFLQLSGRGWVNLTDVSVYASKDFKNTKLAGLE